MLKALFLDMDETLCDTRGANEHATRLLGEAVQRRYGSQLDGQKMARDYVSGIYRHWRDDQAAGAKRTDTYLLYFGRPGNISGSQVHPILEIAAAGAGNIAAADRRPARPIDIIH